MDDLEKRVARLERLVDVLSEDLDAAVRLIAALELSRDRMRREIGALTREAGFDT